jgi:chemotaxis protein methyltransferase CheR
MNESEFEYMRALFHAETGIRMDAGKAYLVELRLRSLAEQAGFSSAGLFLQHLKARPTIGLHRQAVEALLIHETRFFRDEPVFELFRSLLPALVERANRTGTTLGVWSAACSTGQEAYTLAFLLRAELPEETHFRLLATDVSEEALARARGGAYSLFEIGRGLPNDIKHRFISVHEDEGIVAEDIRKSIDFRKLNLAGEWPPLSPMDVVFLRNVLIYFEPALKKNILNNVHRVLRPGGYLFLGNPEAALFDDPRFRPVETKGACCFQSIEPTPEGRTPPPCAS